MRNELFEEAKSLAREVEQNPEEVLQDALDVRLVITPQGELVDFEVYTTLGGPTVWVDAEGVYASWAGEKVFYRCDTSRLWNLLKEINPCQKC